MVLISVMLFIVAFGLGTLVFNGLEMAMHSMMEGACLNDVVFVHPVLHGLFTFLQMHFLFVNSQVQQIFYDKLTPSKQTLHFQDNNYKMSVTWI